MASMVLAVNPIIETGGLIAAIIICLFVFVFVLVTVAFNVGIAFGMGWLREKAEVIKALRPPVVGVNKTAEAAIQGHEPSPDENAVVRVAATVPARVHQADNKIVAATDKVAQGVIEFRARTMQVKGILTTFFKTDRITRLPEEEGINREGLQFDSPGYQILMQEEAEKEGRAPHQLRGDQYDEDVVTAAQLSHANPR